jgi:hypothetical protein
VGHALLDAMRRAGALFQFNSGHRGGFNTSTPSQQGPGRVDLFGHDSLTRKPASTGNAIINLDDGIKKSCLRALLT